MKTVLVLGAQGMLGRFTAQRLKAAGQNVLRGGRRPENAAEFRLVDLDRMDTFSAALQGVDLVVSSIEDPEVRAEREILRRGGILISQATIPVAAQRRLEADAARNAKGTVVLNSGLTGVMGLVVKDLLEQHPEADTVEMGFIGSVAASIGSAGGKTAHRWLTSVPRLSVVPRQFPAPRGMWPCFDMTEYDFIWVSEAVIGKRKFLMYIGLAEKPVAILLKCLDRLGLLKAMTQGMFTAMFKFRRVPKELTREPVRGRIAVYRQGKLLAARGMSAEGDYNSTTLSTMLFSQSLLGLMDKALVPSGLFSVEDLFTLEPLLAGLNDNHISIQPLSS